MLHHSITCIFYKIFSLAILQLVYKYFRGHVRTFWASPELYIDLVSYMNLKSKHNPGAVDLKDIVGALEKVGLQGH